MKTNQSCIKQRDWMHKLIARDLLDCIPNGSEEIDPMKIFNNRYIYRVQLVNETVYRRDYVDWKKLQLPT